MCCIRLGIWKAAVCIVTGMFLFLRRYSQGHLDICLSCATLTYHPSAQCVSDDALLRAPKLNEISRNTMVFRSCGVRVRTVQLLLNILIMNVQLTRGLDPSRSCGHSVPLQTLFPLSWPILVVPQAIKVPLRMLVLLSAF